MYVNILEPSAVFPGIIEFGPGNQSDSALSSLHKILYTPTHLFSFVKPVLMRKLSILFRAWKAYVNAAEGLQNSQFLYNLRDFGFLRELLEGITTKKRLFTKGYGHLLHHI